MQFFPIMTCDQNYIFKLYNGIHYIVRLFIKFGKHFITTTSNDRIFKNVLRF